jgi:uncharacterized protein (UPF0332 family)
MFDPVDFLHLAKKLLSGDEASLRTAVSRAYCASFLLARDRLGLSSRAPEVHQEVIKRMYDTGPSIAHNLHLLRHNRNSADYDTKVPLSYADAQQAIELGERTVEGINALNKLGGRIG